MKRFHSNGYKIDIRAFNEDGSKKTPDEVYADIKANAPEHLMLAVDIFLSNRPGILVTKEEISNALFGEYTDSLDRNIRDAVADLVTYLERPYVATSHDAGYLNCTTVDEIDEGIRDIEKRVKTTRLRIDGLHAARTRLLEGRQRVAVQIPVDMRQGLLW